MKRDSEASNLLPGSDTDLLVPFESLRSEYGHRRLDSIVRSVANDQMNTLLQEGWIPFKAPGKTRSRLQQPKQIDQQLRDDIWCLMYRMRYSYLNQSSFEIEYQGPSGDPQKKTIDVLAEDDETLVVVECRSREDRGRKSLSKDLAESKLARRAVQRLIHRRHGGSSSRKILWLYATRNIIWADKDLDDASQASIKVITENEYQYFDNFIGHMGPAGRFQFLAEYFDGQDIPGLEDVRIPATQGVFGKRKFFSFVTTPRRLLKIAFVNHQALNHPDGRPAYQRMISPNRIRQIQSFIQHGGYFPTNLLLNFTKPCRFDLLPKENTDPSTKFGWLYLPKSYKSAWVIDGQHRLYGYSHLTGKWLDQPIPVIAFELLPTVEEADLFVTINHEQKQVPKSILVSLQADLKINSEVPKERLGALASSVAKALGSDPTGPFFQRFSVQGIHASESQSLTIPEVVNGLLRAGLLGRVVKGNSFSGPLTGSTDELTIKRAHRIVDHYFDLIREANPRRWEQGREGYICTNPGVRAFLLLFAECCNHLNAAGEIDPVVASEQDLVSAVERLIQPVLSFIRADDHLAMKELFSRKFGEGGVLEYFENLAEFVCAATPTFGSEELRKGIALKKDKRKTSTDTDVIALSKDLLDTVIAVLKQHYGDKVSRTGEPDYWRLGVESKKIRVSAYEKQVQDKNDQPIEAFLDIVDLKEIVRQKSNWPLFQDLMNIPLPGEKGKQYYLDWMDRFNELRRIPAHPSGTRVYTEADYEFLAFVKEAFYSKRKAHPLFSS